MTQVSSLTDAVQPLATDLFTLQRDGRFYRVSWASMVAAIGVGPVAPTLGALSLSQTSFTIGTPVSGTVNGASAGSVITATGLPAGITINAAARTFSYDGTGTAATSSVGLVETLAGAVGSPKTTTLSVTIAAAGGATSPFDLSANDNSSYLVLMAL